MTRARLKSIPIWQGGLSEIEQTIRDIDKALPNFLERSARKYAKLGYDSEHPGVDPGPDMQAEAEVYQNACSAMLLVVIQSHIEYWLKQILENALRADVPEDGGFGALDRCFRRNGVKLDAMADKDWRVALYRLANAFKHGGGRLVTDLELPGGFNVKKGNVRYSELPVRTFAAKAASFLVDVASKSNSYLAAGTS